MPDRAKLPTGCIYRASIGINLHAGRIARFTVILHKRMDGPLVPVPSLRRSNRVVGKAKLVGIGRRILSVVPYEAYFSAIWCIMPPDIRPRRVLTRTGKGVYTILRDHYVLYLSGKGLTPVACSSRGHLPLAQQSPEGDTPRIFVICPD